MVVSRAVDAYTKPLCHHGTAEKTRYDTTGHRRSATDEWAGATREKEQPFFLKFVYPE